MIVYIAVTAIGMIIWVFVMGESVVILLCLCHDFWLLSGAKDERICRVDGFSDAL